MDPLLIFMSPGSITITVKLFAAYQEVYGQLELQLELAPGTTVGMVGAQLQAGHPELESLAPVTRYGINWNFVPADTILHQGDEVVLIPPVSGG